MFGRPAGNVGIVPLDRFGSVNSVAGGGAIVVSAVDGWFGAADGCNGATGCEVVMAGWLLATRGWTSAARVGTVMLGAGVGPAAGVGDVARVGDVAAIWPCGGVAAGAGVFDAVRRLDAPGLATLGLPAPGLPAPGLPVFWATLVSGCVLGATCLRGTRGIRPLSDDSDFGVIFEAAAISDGSSG